MCPLKREQARRETQQWVMRRLPTANSIVEIGRKSRSWINWAPTPMDITLNVRRYSITLIRNFVSDSWGPDIWLWGGERPPFRTLWRHGGTGPAQTAMLALTTVPSATQGRIISGVISNFWFILCGERNFIKQICRRPQFRSPRNAYRKQRVTNCFHRLLLCWFFWSAFTIVPRRALRTISRQMTGMKRHGRI